MSTSSAPAFKDEDVSSPPPRSTNKRKQWTVVCMRDSSDTGIVRIEHMQTFDSVKKARVHEYELIKEEVETMQAESSACEEAEPIPDGIKKLKELHDQLDRECDNKDGLHVELKETSDAVKQVVIVSLLINASMEVVLFMASDMDTARAWIQAAYKKSSSGPQASLLDDEFKHPIYRVKTMDVAGPDDILESPIPYTGWTPVYPPDYEEKRAQWVKDRVAYLRERHAFA